jgi:hypothetical protein
VSVRRQVAFKGLHDNVGLVEGDMPHLSEDAPGIRQRPYRPAPRREDLERIAMSFCAKLGCRDLADQILQVLPPNGKVMIPLCDKHATEWMRDAEVRARNVSAAASKRRRAAVR